MTTDTIEAPTAAPAAAPAAAPTPAAPAAPAATSLIHPPASAPAATVSPPGTAPAAPADPFAALLGKVPEKFHVKAGDVVDPAASLAKALEHRDHLERRLGAGDLPPKTPAEYAFTVPEDMHGLELNGERLEAFKAEAHKRGISADTFSWMMGQHLAMVPDLMQGAAKMSADEARAALAQSWTTPDAMSNGIADAQRALRTLPADVLDATADLGTNPAFIRALAHIGAQMREDRPPASPTATSTAVDVRALEMGEAYRNPRHPDHERVSAQVADHYRRVAGDKPI